MTLLILKTCVINELIASYPKRQTALHIACMMHEMLT